MDHPVQPLNSTLHNPMEIAYENNQESNDIQNQFNSTIIQHYDNTIYNDKNYKIKKEQYLRPLHFSPQL
jgi:translation initiation factor RLI1